MRNIVIVISIVVILVLSFKSCTKNSGVDRETQVKLELIDEMYK